MRVNRALFSTVDICGATEALSFAGIETMRQDPEELPVWTRYSSEIVRVIECWTNVMDQSTRFAMRVSAATVL